ncbi:S8 family peptidase [Bacillus thuringiensis]|uniref:S8 family peptidase n=1 Tax=Bacillus thuringiensis TaxID=1428 RepID=UPI0021D69039|nr:S8/S53 family peptidase [Bacillus thuringiensis]MCU7667752.1 S8/S53 family peptidase [Bacillus thuringiensis]
MKKILFMFTSLIIVLLSSSVVHAEEKNESQKANYFVEFEFPKITDENKPELKSKQKKFNKIIERGTEVIETFENFPFILIKTDEKTIEKIRKIDGVVSVSKEETFNSKTESGETPIQQTCSECDNNYLLETKAQALHNQGFTGKGTKVAVMDTGVLSDHQDINLKTEVACYKDALKCKVTTGDDPLDAHGTMVAGIINGKGIQTKGVAPGADLYSIKFGYTNMFGNWNSDESSFIKGIDWAINNGIHIINMSFVLQGDYSLGNTDGILYKAFARAATDYGILMVAATGNESTNSIIYPASSDYVLGVSNWDYLTDKLYPDSNYGRGTSFAAPGVRLWMPTGIGSKSYVGHSGTSFSSPMVAGVAALLREKYISTKSNITNLDLIEYMKFMAKEVDAYGSGKNDYVGYGLIQGEIGNSVDKQITINQTYSLHNMPSDNFKLSLSVNPQSLNAIRQYKDWYEVNTWVGPRWIKPMYYYGDFQIILNQDTTNLYDSQNGNLIGVSLAPQTVKAVQRSGDWFEIKTWLGYKWIKPYSYSIN